MKFKQFHIPLYHGSLVVAQGKDFKKMCERLEINWDDVDLGETSGAATITVEEDGAVEYFMLFRSEVDWREIAHECLHFMNRLFSDRGVKLDPLNDEPQAYLLGWAVTRCSETLTKIRKPIVVSDYEVKESINIK